METYKLNPQDTHSINIHKLKIMILQLTNFEFFYGILTFIAVIISIILGIVIAQKYRKFKKVEFILVGLTWILLVSPYWSDAIQFITLTFFDYQISTVVYFFIANAFIAPIHIIWILALTNLIFHKQKKTLMIIFTTEAIIYEVFFLYSFLIDPNQIGTQMSAFVVEWAIWIQIYLLLSIALFLVTSFLFARQSLKSENRELRVKGWFLVFAIILYTSAAFIDVIGADSPNEFTIFLARTCLILSSIFFYIGFTLPRFIKELFIKS
jgi:hypothetical protein